MSEQKEMKLIIGYCHGEQKSVITIPNITNSKVLEIAESIAVCDKPRFLLNLLEEKGDVLVVTMSEFMFFYATPVTEEDKKRKR